MVKYAKCNTRPTRRYLVYSISERGKFKIKLCQDDANKRTTRFNLGKTIRQILKRDCV